MINPANAAEYRTRREQSLSAGRDEFSYGRTLSGSQLRVNEGFVRHGMAY